MTKSKEIIRQKWTISKEIINYTPSHGSYSSSNSTHCATVLSQVAGIALLIISPPCTPSVLHPCAS